MSVHSAREKEPRRREGAKGEAEEPRRREGREGRGGGTAKTRRTRRSGRRAPLPPEGERVAEGRVRFSVSRQAARAKAGRYFAASKCCPVWIIRQSEWSS